MGHYNNWLCPEHVAVIGGGRWARVLLEVLCGLVHPSVRISTHSPHNAHAMAAWAAARGLESRLHVSAGYPRVLTGQACAVIVANAVRDHEKAIDWALSKHFPVLVEKPVTLNFDTTQRMAKLALSQQTYLAAAHVFLFARYVGAFVKLVAETGGARSVRVQWMDPRAEIRYGEAKSYDPGLTIYADLLPHIVPILGALATGTVEMGPRLEFLRGGAHLRMNVSLSNIPCEIEMVRNGDNRQRLIEVTTREGLKSLDFAKEPGTIVDATSVRCGDPAWDTSPKPVATMLRAFLQGAAGEVLDERLDIRIASQANRIIDQLSPVYHAAVSAFLVEKCSDLREDIDADLRYALNEILYMDDPLSPVPLEQRIQYIFRNLKSVLLSPLDNEYRNRPVDLIRSLLKQGKLTSFS